MSTATVNELTTEKKVVRDDEFIRVYNSSKTAEEAADRLGMKVESLKVRKSTLSKFGVPFKTFPRKSNLKRTPEVIAQLTPIADGRMQQANA